MSSPVEASKSLIELAESVQVSNPVVEQLKKQGADYHREHIKDYIQEDTLPKQLNNSFQYWRSASSEPGKTQILEHFHKRGTLGVDYTNPNQKEFKCQGAAYFEPLDAERFPEATYVGVSYQVNALAAIDSVAETFKVVIDMNCMYKIQDEEKPIYQEFQNRDLSLQQIADDSRVKTQPPIFEVRNAVTHPEFLQERVTKLEQCYDHRNGVWAWYVSLFIQLRCDCYEEFEMQRFPFTRNSLQVFLQSKIRTQHIVLVPYNCRSTMPHHKLNREAKKPEPLLARGNTFKADRTIGNWIVEQHHIAFVPFDSLASMPSGNKFAMCVITVQCKQNYTFYLWNSVPIVWFLPLLAASAKFECFANLWGRIEIVLAMLLTMATYKVSIGVWMPRKEYMTYMDWYFLSGFLCIVLIATAVSMTSIWLSWIEDDFEFGEDQCKPHRRTLLPARVEDWFVGVLCLVWIAVHIVVLCYRNRISRSWPVIMKQENETLKGIASAVADELDKQALKQHSRRKPLAPEDDDDG